MAVKLGHARISEKGTAEGVPGDQTTHEVEISDWYNGGWLAVYRPNNSTDAAYIANTCEAICKNDNVGYSQDDRMSMYKLLVAALFDATQIKTPCNTDCSQLVASCVNAAGIPVSKDMTTRNEDTVLMGTGKFTRLTANKYTQNSDYLKRGDILRKSGHTAIVVQGGVKADEDIKNHTTIYADFLDAAKAGCYRATTDVYMREGGGLSYRAMCVVFEDNHVYNYGYYSIDDRGVIWLYCEYACEGIKYTGFVSSKCLVKAVSR